MRLKLVLSRALPLGALVLSLTGCGLWQSQTRYRGQTTDPRDVAELVPGVSTKADVMEELGSPSDVPSFDQQTWLYLGQETHTRIARTPGIISQAVTVVKFDQNGVLQSIDTKTPPNGMQLAIAGGATASPGSSSSFLGQVIGNIGRFSPSGGSGASNPLSGFSSGSSSDLGQGGTTPGTQSQ